MRTWTALAALTLATLAFAGCTTDDADGNTIPTGPGQGSPTVGDDGGDDDVGSGDDGGNGDGDRVIPDGDQAWDRATNESFPGIVLDGTMDQYDANGSARFNVGVRNEGTAAYKVHGVCVTSWSEAMFRGDEQVQPRVPMAHCEAFGLKPFEDDSWSLDWNRTVWVDDSEGPDYGSFQPASDGEYRWVVQFQVFKGGDEDYEYDEQTTLELEFTVLV